MQYEKEVNSGLKRASKESNRDGKWATPPETRNESKGIPQSCNVRQVLDQLVKENRAEKKRGELLYRPAGGGAGGAGGAFGEGYRTPDYGNGRTPWDDGDITKPTGDRGNTEETRDPSKTTGGNVAAAVGAMIVGGATPGRSTGGTGITHL